MRFFIYTILLLIGYSSYAQQPHTISLQQSKEAALKYSKAIQNSELDIESAEAGIKIAKAAHLPSVDVTGVGVYGFKDLVPAMPEMLPEGINNFYMAGVAAVQPLYTGGKIKSYNELAELQLQVNKLRAQQSVDSVLLITAQKYWNLVNLQEQHKVLEANERLLDTLLKQQNDLLASGLIARNDLLKVKVQRSRLLLNKSQLESGKKIALLDFSLYVGIPYDSSLVMQDTLATDVLPPLYSLGPDTSLVENSNYQLLQKMLEGERLQTRLTKADYMPTVSIGVNAAQAGVLDRGIGSTFVPLSFGMVSIPISDWWSEGKHKMKQRAISEQKAKNNFESVSDQLKVGITKAWYDLVDSRKEIAFAQENLEQASSNLQVSQDNYASGLASVTEVMDAQALYQEAASALARAYANFQLKKESYAYASGISSGQR
ncbi:MULTISPECIES: TolC family protein [Hymenobacteraceae]|uniref:Outer membrane protein TolC n=3 Tax=Pontibacter TaxID=323449 RepID=A0A239JCT3_9BACT|nr:MULTISPECIES: TolC family protein [Hymenobacteraceae]PRY08354.1 outer membrane protein TolC [Pontibacter ummariensis]PVY38353.1 outer membrane protein TolC [Pontibacter virosus]SNT03412.1 Outer membrane protein TolC [Pontibacter ummariensis]